MTITISKIKRLFLFITIGLFLQSCLFIIYSYRGYLDTEFSIPNNTADTAVRQQIGKLIYRLSTKQKFYTRYASATNDSLYFYGPDYHHLRFSIYEDKQTTKVRLRYSGYNGLRGRPPCKKFIQSVTDSLKTIFGATQVIYKDVSNEKKRSKNST